MNKDEILARVEQIEALMKKADADYNDVDANLANIENFEATSYESIAWLCQQVRELLAENERLRERAEYLCHIARGPGGDPLYPVLTEEPTDER